MSAKRPATSNLGGDKPKKRRMSLSLESKLNIVKRHEDGEGANSIARALRLAQSIVSTVIKNLANIKMAGETSTTLMAKKVTRQREPIYEEMERLLKLWIEDLTQNNMPLSTTLVTVKALSIWEDLKKKDYQVKEGTSFSASKAVIQPMDQGIISTFKAYYLRRRTMRQLLDAIDKPDKPTIKQFWSNYNIKKAIDNIDAAWKEVSENAMNGSWRKLWEDCVTDFTGFPDLKDVRKDLVRLSHSAGFNEVDEEDIQQLFDSHAEPLSNEDLMEIEQERALADQEDNDDDEPRRELGIKELREAFQHIEKGMELFREYDLNPARSGAATQAVEQAIKPYKEIYERKRRQAKQTTISSFFKPSTLCKPSTPSTSATNPLSPPTLPDVSPVSHPTSPPTLPDVSPGSLPTSPATLPDVSPCSHPTSQPDANPDSPLPVSDVDDSE
ncbi:hypothetical protein Pmani_020873 [Petrolisthes manimaculis]|uniref:Uncharacterized protein n=1 Tax=Petrolisthes manimaculis TaxID=1843537 RepID=A0AAE1U627_9EUCA|nr:hypothetical protein Pmani_020873 [Petrolisthes manimaculis]